jgi:hypothetical protein
VRTIWVLGLLLLLAQGCRFGEPEPSEEVYRAAVAPVPTVSTGMSPVAPTGDEGATSDVSGVHQRALAHAAGPGGFRRSDGEFQVDFRPPADYLRTELSADKVMGSINGDCRVRLGHRVFDCLPSEKVQVGIETQAARILHLHGLAEDHRLALQPDGSLLVRGRGGPALVARFAADDGRLVAVEHEGLPLLSQVLVNAQPQTVVADAFMALEPVRDGLMEVVRTEERRVLCTGHIGGLSQIGATVRRLGDQAEVAQLQVDDRGGVLLDVMPDGGESVCVAIRGAGAGTRVLGERTVARLWHRGAYSALAERQAPLEGWVRDGGRRIAERMGQRLWLYVDPESVRNEDELVSSLEIPVMVQ